MLTTGEERGCSSVQGAVLNKLTVTYTTSFCVNANTKIILGENAFLIDS